MIRAESIRIALAGILHNRLRSADHARHADRGRLGDHVGRRRHWLSRQVQKTIEGLGTNLLQINRLGGGFGGPGGGRATVGTQSRATNLTAADVTALEDKTQNPDVMAVAPVITGSVTAVYNGASYSPSSAVGTTPSYQQIKDYVVAEGNFFTDADEAQHNWVAVIGETVATNLFGTADPIGNVVQFNGASFQIVGLLKQKGTNGIQDQDDVVIAPLTAVQDSCAGYSTSFSNISVEATSPSKEADAQVEVTATLESTHKIAADGTDDFRILNGQLARNVNVIEQGVHHLARHRRRHQPARRRHRRHEHHVGDRHRAHPRDRYSQGDRRQGPTSSASSWSRRCCSGLGGVAGVAFGIGGSHFRIIGIQPVVRPYSVVLAFGVAVVTGLFFGLYPASRAARLLPIEALRYE